MKIVVKGDINKKFCADAVKEAKKLINCSGLDFYFLENENYCEDIISNFSSKKKFMHICYFDKSTFTFRDKSVVVVMKNRNYLKRNKMALIGLLLHEIMHAKQHRRGVYKNFLSLSKKSITKYCKLIKSNKINVTNLMKDVSSTVILLLKDIYCNTELIKKGLGDYLLDFYYSDLSIGKKTCPSPVFYGKFKRAAKRDINVIRVAFEFEFSLLSVYLPFRGDSRFKSIKLINKVKNCYEVNIDEVARKCHELREIYCSDFGNKEFDKLFFDGVNGKIVNLLK